MKITTTIIGWLLAAGLLAQNPAPVVQISVADISCTGRKDGRLELTLLQGAPPVDFSWTNLNTSAQGLGQFVSLNQPILLSNLDAGLYRFQFTSADGVDTTVQRLLNEPLPLNTALFLLTGSGSFQLTCAGDAEAEVLCDVTGGTPPLTFAWSNADKGSRADSLPPGPVSVTVTDARGCMLEADTVLKAPPPISATVSAEGETCLGQNTGQISVGGVSGGVPPYQYALNNDPPGAQTAWTDLPHGQYFLSVIDAAGCVHQEGIILPSGLEFTLKLGADTTMLSGDTLLLTLQVDPPADTILWSPARGVQMKSPTEVLLFPSLGTTYQVTAINSSGCIATDNIEITVNRHRDIYIPNAFAPQGQEAVNQSFTVFGGGGIRTVALLRVYDRFGRLWFENRNFPVNDPASGWRGADGNDQAPPGVYLWRAVLRFTDGREEVLQGDVTVVR